MSNESELIKNTVAEQDTSLEQESYQESAAQQAGVAEMVPELGPDWEGETKKFQSMYDRSQSEVDRLKKLEPIGDLLESRPDLVQVLQEKIANPNGASEQTAQLDASDFNPWDAEFEPGTPSFKHRKAERQKDRDDIIRQVRGEFEQREADTQ